MNDTENRPAYTHQPSDDGSFLWVVIFSGIALIIGFIVAFLIVSGAGKRLIPGKHKPHPTSQLILPAPAQGTTESSFIFAQQPTQNRV